MLYKNMVGTLPLILFGFVSLFSGIMYFNQWTYICYNTVLLFAVYI